MEHMLMGVDVGTTAAKALVMTLDGRVLASGRHSYGIRFPQPRWAEQDPEELTQGVFTAIRNAVQRLDSETIGLISALAVSSQRNTMIPVDANGRFLRPAITWMDTRAIEECRALTSRFGDDSVYASTGVPISPIWSGAFIAWIRRHEPEVYGKTDTFCLVHDYVLRRLGAGGSYLDYSNACETMLFDFRALSWDKELVREVGASTETLPVPVASGIPIGQLSGAASRATMLPEGVLLVSGGGDQQCAALGAGVTRPGLVEISLGTAANLLAPVDAPLLDPERRLLCHRPAGSDGFVLEGALISAASTLDLVRDAVYAEVPAAERVTTAESELKDRSVAGAGGLLCTPHFAGAGSPYWNALARGAIVGLSMSTSRADLVRAVMEGIALELRQSLMLLRSWGLGVDRVVLTGGGSRSTVWPQIHADVHGVPTETLIVPEAAAVGAAILAGVGSGALESIEEGVRRMVRVDRRYLPRSRETELYRHLSQIQDRMITALDAAGVYRELHAVS